MGKLFWEMKKLFWEVGKLFLEVRDYFGRCKNPMEKGVQHDRTKSFIMSQIWRIYPCKKITVWDNIFVKTQCFAKSRILELDSHQDMTQSQML